MKLSTALAVLIAIQRHGHRMMCVLASADDHERKLRINQDDAAKRVKNAVGLAKASINAGDVHGVALPLNFVALSDGFHQQLTVALRLPGVDRDQHVQVDTGSSSLAFCNKSLAEEATDITKMNYAQCNRYGGSTCPDVPNTTDSFYVGQVFQGNIAAYDMSNGEEIASMDDVNFVIMSEVQNYACQKPMDGIIDVAYSYLNDVVEIPSPDFDALNLWNQTCERDHPYYKSVGKCNTGNMTEKLLPSPLQQSLKWGVDSGYDSVEAFGLYCDYAATIGSKTDTIVPSLGIYFGGDVALNNTFYNSGTPQVARVFPCDGRYVIPSEGVNQWYLLNLHSIRIPGMNNQNYSDFDQCSYCSGHARCFTDSGNPGIELPLPTDVCEELSSADPDTLGKMGPLLLDVEGVNGSTVTLSLPLHWLVDLGSSGHVTCTNKTGRFILGFPIHQYYYLVYDMGNDTITFVDLPNTNENEAFIDGPELGGTNEPSTSNEPSTGSRHTGSPSTDTFVMAGLLLLACKYIF